MKVCKQEEVLVELCLTMRMIWIGIHLSFLQRQQHLRHQPLYLCRKKCKEYGSKHLSLSLIAQGYWNVACARSSLNAKNHCENELGIVNKFQLIRPQ